MYTCNDKVIITIGRTFGSGGREVGRKVAAELGIPFYDKELLAIEAEESGFDADILNRFDEKKINTYLYSMAFSPYEDDRWPLDMMVQKIQMRAIKAVADRGSCVIVGRRADKILHHQYDILRVFVSAPMEDRIARVSKRDGLSEENSKKKIIKADRERKSYYNSYGGGEWGEAANYNLCIDNGDLGVNHSAALILRYLKLKGKISLE